MSSATSKILIVEDEENLGVTLCEYLISLGNQCKLAQTAAEARDLFKAFNPEIIIMDIGLPDGDGLSLAKEFRNIRKNFALLFLSALNDPDTKVQGLEIGAEDYMTKPFAIKELTFRLDRIMILHSKAQQNENIKLGNLKINFPSYEIVDAKGQTVSLSQKECAILEQLYKQKNQVVSREELMAKIWGEEKYPSSRTIDNYIVKLRKWCDTDNSNLISIESIRSVGYKFCIKE